MQMILVEQQVYKPKHPDYPAISHICFLSKNLYNSTLYEARKQFFETGKLGRYSDINRKFTHENQADYRALPAKVSKLTQQLVDKAIISYFGLLKAYKAGNIEHKPKLPKYLPKEGRQVVTYTKQAISTVRSGFIRLSGTDTYIPTKQSNVQFVRLVPSKSNKTITVEVGYQQAYAYSTALEKYASVDLGINNLATLVFTDRTPIMYNGRPLKSINQYYNKRLAELKSKQDLSGSKRKTTNRIKALHSKRNNKVKDYMHKVTRELTNQLVANQVTIVVVGYNKGWKQDVNLGKKTNQKFVQIPFIMFISMLTYKCALSGIRVDLNEESYTSKCSFVDNEVVCKHEKYLGKRVNRGLFKTATGKLINADVNGAYNILRKYLKEAWTTNIFSDCVEVCSAPTVFTVNR